MKDTLQGCSGTLGSIPSVSMTKEKQGTYNKYENRPIREMPSEPINMNLGYIKGRLNGTVPNMSMSSYVNSLNNNQIPKE